MGAVGELCVGGVGVGRGYLGDVGLTLDKFRPDPFNRVPGAGCTARAIWSATGRTELDYSAAATSR